MKEGLWVGEARKGMVEGWGGSVEDYNFSLKMKTGKLLTEKKKKGGDNCQTDSDILRKCLEGNINTW